MSKENEKTLTLEERFAHLEQIVARMEDADVSLDEAFELYKKGLDEVKSANDMVQGMETATDNWRNSDELKWEFK